MRASHYTTSRAICGITRPLAEWLALAGITDNAYRERRKRGWTEVQALTTPAGEERQSMTRPWRKST